VPQIERSSCNDDAVQNAARPPVAVSLLVIASLALVPGSSGAPAEDASQLTSEQFASSFVTRSGTRLLVAGRPFRFGGANVEWLGVVGYGPFDPNGPRPPSHYEIDDAMATARELGARVVRSQTMGDSVGCPVCIEPARGQFNQAAFERIDYALASARRHGIKIIPTIVGDDARAGGTGCVNLRWRGIVVPNCTLINMAPFWTEQTVIDDVKAHITALLEHVNVYTRVAYKDDPTILGWDLLNGGGSPTPWTRQIVEHIRSIDRRHLILSGPNNASVPGVDVCVAFVYPHWHQAFSTVRAGIDQCRRARKPFVAYEYGWDRTNYATLRGLQAFLRTLERMPHVAGDAFWALQAHRNGHGWMPIPADAADPTTARHGESGQWWALYYPGIQTMVNTAADMTVRAEAIRRHNYAMSRVRVPRHRVPPRPTVTSAAYGPTVFFGRVGVRVYWQGSAGAKDYSVQRAPARRGPWRTICRRCATDVSDGHVDLSRGAKGAWYRVIPYNLDGRAGRASAPLRASG
jgi:mannan endo-1,4-beta-mannosidase